MMDKSFPTLVVASTLTGTSLCEMSGFDPIMDCASHLFGAPIWLHEVIHEPTKDAYTEEGYRQFPGMPTRVEAQADWRAAANKAVRAYGNTILVRQGDHGRRESPLTTARSVAPHAKIIVTRTA